MSLGWNILEYIKRWTETDKQQENYMFEQNNGERKRMVKWMWIWKWKCEAKFAESGEKERTWKCEKEEDLCKGVANQQQDCNLLRVKLKLTHFETSLERGIITWQSVPVEKWTLGFQDKFESDEKEGFEGLSTVGQRRQRSFNVNPSIYGAGRWNWQLQGTHKEEVQPVTIVPM